MMVDGNEFVSLSECLRLIEASNWNRCIDNDTQAKIECNQTIKTVNTISKTERSPEVLAKLNILSRYLLDYYDLLNSKTKQGNKNLEFKIRWLSSKVHKYTFPPVIKFSDELTSFDGCFVSHARLEEDIPVPEKLSVAFQAFEKTDWTVKREYLGDCYQDLLTNCSFVSAVLSLVEIGRTDILSDIIVPFGDSVNYKIKMHFNGTARNVDVNNSLPLVNGMQRNLIIRSHSNKSLHWLAFIEKAFLKVMGNGYNLQGSNMAFDVYMLSGWIPEIIIIHEGGSVDLATIWQQFEDGKVTLGAGTGQMSSVIASKLNLVPEHDYSIVAYSKESNRITLKNPWVENSIENRYIKLTHLDQMAYLYVNWDPSIFKYSTQLSLVHVRETIDFYNYENPQCSFCNNSDTEQEVWILLEYHMDTKSEQRSASIYTYATKEGEKVFTPKDSLCISKDNNLKVRVKLTKLSLAPRQYYTSVVYGKHKGTMTIRIYHNIAEDVKLVKAAPKYHFFTPTINERWTTDCSGGNWSLSSFIINPEYHLEVRDHCSLIIGLFTNSEVSVNIHIFHSSRPDKARKIRNFDKSKLLFDENYNKGYQSHGLTLSPGHYKVVVSTFDRVVAPYTLVCNYGTYPDVLTLSKVPASLGLFTNSSSLTWSGANRLKVYFHVPYSNTAFSFHISYSTTSDASPSTIADYRPAMRASLFNNSSSAPLQINDKWSNELFGIFVDCSISKPGDYVLLVERFEAGSGFCHIKVAANRQFSLI